MNNLQIIHSEPRVWPQTRARPAQCRLGYTMCLGERRLSLSSGSYCEYLVGIGACGRSSYKWWPRVLCVNTRLQSNRGRCFRRTCPFSTEIFSNSICPSPIPPKRHQRDCSQRSFHRYCMLRQTLKAVERCTSFPDAPLQATSKFDRSQDAGYN